MNGCAFFRAKRVGPLVTDNCSALRQKRRNRHGVGRRSGWQGPANRGLAENFRHQCRQALRLVVVPVGRGGLTVQFGETPNDRLRNRRNVVAPEINQSRNFPHFLCLRRRQTLLNLPS